MARKRESKKKNRKIRIELSSTRALVWVGILIFFLAWIFALGIFVGRDLLPEDIKPVARLKELIRREEASSKIELEEEDSDNPKLAFYEKLSTKKDEARKKETIKKHVVEPKPGPKPLNKPKPESVPKPLPKPVQVKGAPVVVAPVKVEEKGPPPGPDDSMDPRLGAMAFKARYTVQVAALESQEMADGMIARLRGKGHPAYYYDVKVKGKTYYRIRCGRFLSRSEAEEYAKNLSKNEGVKGFVSELE